MPKGIYDRKVGKARKSKKAEKTEVAPSPHDLFEELHKPILIKCGNTFINPEDVSEIREVKKGLFIVKFVSNPSPDYPCWLREDEAAILLNHFKIEGDL